MFPEEATWFCERILSIDSAQVSPMLNVGSSTIDFRSVVQPHIEKNLFSPILRNGIRVVHSDIKMGPGVDIVGDLNSKDFVSRLAHMGFKSVMCSNMLEHVREPNKIISNLLSIVPRGGYLFVSCPYSYPFHPDPIDTMLRPTPDELAEMFAGVDIVFSEIILSDRYAFGNLRPRHALREVLRLMLPIYRPARWLWHFRRTKESCVVLKKS